jgi:hypothetical protein
MLYCLEIEMNFNFLTFFYALEYRYFLNKYLKKYLNFNIFYINILVIYKDIYEYMHII